MLRWFYRVNLPNLSAQLRFFGARRRRVRGIAVSMKRSISIVIAVDRELLREMIPRV